MATQNFNIEPYYDDFNESKNYQQILFRPGYAVQARELTQIQSILQKQIANFGSHIFKDGVIVSGGDFTYDNTNAYYIKLQDDNTTDYTNFTGKFITDKTGRGVRAYVVEGFNAVGVYEPTLIVRYVSNLHFNQNEDLTTEDTTQTLYVGTVLNNSNYTGNSSTFSINDGVFFIDGYFVSFATQTIVLNKYANNNSLRVGFEIENSVVDENSDSSLLDPALFASNYQAPGAARFKKALNLTTRNITSEDDSLFVEVVRLDYGLVTRVMKNYIYNELEKTLARRTYDESGNYTVRPFMIRIKDSKDSNTMNVVLETGKAYVQGYEYELTYPYSMEITRGKDIANTTNYDLTTRFENSVSASKIKGPISLDYLSEMTVHCVNTASLNTQTTTTLSATEIGKVRIRAIEYDSGLTSTQLANTAGAGIYRMFLYDTFIGSRANTCSGVGTANTIVLDANAASQTNAYSGAIIRIVSNNGTSVNETRQITSYNGTTKTATVSRNFSFGVPSTSTVFSIDFQISEAESFVTNSSTTIVSSADIDPLSKYTTLQDSFQSTFLTDTNYNSLVYPLPYSYIAPGTLTNITFSGRTTAVPAAFGAGNQTSFDTILGTTTIPGNGTLSGTDAADNFFVQVVTPGSGSVYTAGQIVNLANTTNIVTISTSGSGATAKSTVTMTIPGIGSGATATVYYKFDSELGSSFRKTKTLLNANTAMIEYASFIDTINSNTSLWAGSTLQPGLQLTMLSAGTANLRTPGLAQSLYVADVVSLAKVYDFGTKAITTANISTAIDITSSYVLDSGQNDNSYEHASITLKPGKSGPTGNVAILADYFEHSSAAQGPGYFSADSYPTYGSIPKYTSPSTGKIYNLRDCIDFRPMRQKGSSGVSGLYSADKNNSKLILPISGTDFRSSFGYYLPRIDKVVLTKDREFGVIKGIPSLNPKEPPEREDAMTLYKLSIPAYTANTSDVNTVFVENKRYTMRDIGEIEKRIDRIEYYTALNFAEKSAYDIQIIDDETGLVRFKNGIIADTFTGHAVGDVLNSDYNCAIDSRKQELRPSFYTRNFMLKENQNSGLTGSYIRKGGIITLPFTEKSFISQAIASKSGNVNPYNIAFFLGLMTLNPSSDVWFDTTQLPDTITYDENVAAFRASQAQAGIVWNDWQTIWSGEPVDTTIGTLGSTTRTSTDGSSITTTTDQDILVSRSVATTQQRVGTLTTVGSTQVQTFNGNKVVSITTIPFMRQTQTLFVGHGFMPQTSLYGFFDGYDVTNYINNLNWIQLTSNTANAFIETAGNNELVEIYEPATSKVLATARVARAKAAKIALYEVTANVAAGNGMFVSTNSTFIRSANTTRAITANVQVQQYFHYTGNVVSATSSTVVLSHNMFNANNSTNSSLQNKVLKIVAGTGAGQNTTISSYTPSTRTAAVSPSFTTVPDATSIYSIDTLTTDTRGEIWGELHTPPSSTNKFRVGEKVFRLIDNSSDSLSNSLTNADSRFFAQGTLTSSSNFVTSTRVPVITRSSVTDQQTYTTVTQRTETRTTSSTELIPTTPAPTTTLAPTTTPEPEPVIDWRWMDPLAQTFLVDQQSHPNGVFISSLRLMIETKDDNIPLRVQIRPVVNGYPHSSQVVPFADKFIYPENINEVDSSTLGVRFANSGLTAPFDDNSLYTNVVFDSPVYLNPGQEYAIVLIANSFMYRVYISRSGESILGTNRLISSQPYLGVLFKSQNSSTWTPVQEEDLMFQLMQAQFGSSSGSVEFTLKDPPSSNTALDLFQITQQNLMLKGTSIEYYYATNLEDYTKFEINDNHFFYDNLGRRTLTNANTSFKIKTVMYSSDPDISPVIDLERMSLIAVENNVNNLGIGNNNIIITNGGVGYTDNTSVTITITGGNGTGATAKALVANGNVSGIVITNSGSGYTTTPNVVISRDGTATQNATAVIVGENQSSGGPAYSRYITRKVTLADGLDAGDLRIYLDAYKPVEGNIYVYYKVLSADDTSTFDSKNYQLMTMIEGSGLNSINENDFKQLIFSPGENNAPRNNITYDGHNNFKYFAIKIVMTSSNPTKVPKIHNLRGLALPPLH